MWWVTDGTIPFPNIYDQLPIMHHSLPPAAGDAAAHVPAFTSLTS
jgi:hypothetical protein